MHFESHIKKYPLSTWEDMVKLCYQASFGAEHILSDIDGAEKYFYSEFNSLIPCDGEICEYISDNVCRINMAAWKAEGLCPGWLFEMFRLSCKVAEDGEGIFSRGIEDLKTLYPNMADDIDGYLEKGVRAIHHSSVYREAYDPHYRIVSARVASLVPILRMASQHSRAVIAIDGGAA